MNRALQHPEDDQLFRYADGELPARASGKVRSHLEACWECRVELAELQATVGECVRYRKNVLQRHLPSPPAPWMDIYQRFSAIDASPEPVFFDRLRRLWQFFPASSAKRWATAMVTMMVLVVLFLRFRQTPSVEAAELLQKAIVAADSRPDKPRLIQIRTSKQRLTRVTSSKGSVPASTADADAINSLQALFQAANYDWEDPLSAKSYLAWRNQLADKRDEVNQERDSYRIRTNTGSGELMQATLTLTMQDLRPVEGRFEFRNQEWVEIEEIPGDVMPPSMTTTPQSRPANSIIGTPAPPSIAGPATAIPAATIGDELRVLALLHAMGADLGDPIEISRNNGNVIVNGAGIPAERQQEIYRALNSLPRVIIRFSGAAPIKVQPEGLRADSALTPDIVQLQARIAEQIGGRAYFDQFASQILDMAEPLMSRAYALRHLAERFTPELESELGVEDRLILGRIRAEHAAALRQQSAEMEGVLKPLLSSVPGMAGGASPGAIPAQAWQPATEEIFQSARRVERLLAVMFGAAQGESASGQLPSQLMSNLAQLRAGLDAYDHLTSTERREKR